MEPVVLSNEEYMELFEQSIKYQCLVQAGVDNWSGYPEAMENAEEILSK